MPAKRAATSSASRPPPAKKPDLKRSSSAQGTLGFAARKNSSAGATSKKGKAAASTTAAAAQAPRKKGMSTAKVEVVDLSDDGNDDEAALEALAELDRQAPMPAAAAPVVEEGGELNPKAARWTKPYKEALAALGGQKPIHCEDEDRTLTILRVFDNDTRFGPSTSISRLERWERAQKWGLNPPAYVREILTTKQGKADQELRETVFYARI